jgi:hypothetical protein
MKRAGQVACVKERSGEERRAQERRGVHRVLVGKPEGQRERDHSEEPGVDRSIILR